MKRIKINARLKPYPFFEIRYIKANMRGSTGLLSVFANRFGFGILLYPFVFSVQIIRSIRPTPLTKEEIEEIKKHDTDFQ